MSSMSLENVTMTGESILQMGTDLDLLFFLSVGCTLWVFWRILMAIVKFLERANCCTYSMLNKTVDQKVKNIENLLGHVVSCKLGVRCPRDDCYDFKIILNDKFYDNDNNGKSDSCKTEDRNINGHDRSQETETSSANHVDGSASIIGENGPAVEPVLSTSVQNKAKSFANVSLPNSFKQSSNANHDPAAEPVLSTSIRNRTTSFANVPLFSPFKQSSNANHDPAAEPALSTSVQNRATSFANVPLTNSFKQSSNANPDPQKWRQIPQYLVCSLHAKLCNEESKQCSLLHCKTMEDVLEHMASCQVGENCSFPHCSSAKQTISYWKHYNQNNCPTRRPVEPVDKKNARIETLESLLGMPKNWEIPPPIMKLQPRPVSQASETLTRIPLHRY